MDGVVLEKQIDGFTEAMLNKIRKYMLSASPTAKMAAVILFDMMNADSALRNLGEEIYHEFRSVVMEEVPAPEDDSDYLQGMLCGMQAVKELYNWK